MGIYLLNDLLNTMRRAPKIQPKNIKAEEKR
jgi:hypothetical protein